MFRSSPRSRPLLLSGLSFFSPLSHPVGLDPALLRSPAIGHCTQLSSTPFSTPLYSNQLYCLSLQSYLSYVVLYSVATQPTVLFQRFSSVLNLNCPKPFVSTCESLAQCLLLLCVCRCGGLSSGPHLGPSCIFPDRPHLRSTISFLASSWFHYCYCSYLFFPPLCVRFLTFVSYLASPNTRAHIC